MHAYCLIMDNVRLVCACCKKRIQRHSKILTCSVCYSGYHIQCIPLTRQEFDHILNHSTNWFCPACNRDIFPCNLFDEESDFLEALHDIYADNSLNFELINNMVFNPFVINVCDCIILHT